MRPRLRLLGLGAASVVAFTVLMRGAGPPTWPRAWPGPEHGPAAREPMATPSPAEVAVDPLPPPPARDIFRYAEPPAPAFEPGPGGAEVRDRAPDAPPAPPPFPLRLVGLVWRAGRLHAAVATVTGVVVVAPGDVVEGYTVLAIDEDAGLRLRAPDGCHRTIPEAAREILRDGPECDSSDPRRR
jgi:hypothetical protein